MTDLHSALTELFACHPCSVPHKTWNRAKDAFQAAQDARESPFAGREVGIYGSGDESGLERRRQEAQHIWPYNAAFVPWHRS